MKTNSSVLAFVIFGAAICIILMTPPFNSANVSIYSPPEIIFLCFLVGAFSIFFPRAKATDDLTQPVGLVRRCVALNIDAFAFGMLFAPFATLFTLTVEYFATGTWQWSFERSEFLPRDFARLLVGFASLYSIFYYFYKHAALSKPTPGQYVMGYRIAPASNGTPNYKSRVFRGAIAAWFSIFAVIIYRDVKDGIYPWDRKTNTRAVAITT